MTPIRIYALSDPRTDRIFYVGASSQNNKMLLSRHSQVTHGTRHELSTLKINPVILILDKTTSVKRAAALEEYWFYQFKSWGFSMENKMKHGFVKYQGDGRKRCVKLKKLCAAALDRIKDGITQSDKKCAMQSVGISYHTLRQILNGNFTNVDKSIATIAFLRNCQRSRISV